MYQGAILPDLEATRPRPRDYCRALRPHQWAKNLLLFVPVAASHRWTGEVLGHAVLGTLVFCLAASSAYVLNDLLDVAADRLHPRKRLRPFACGLIPMRHGAFMSGLLMVSALAGSAALGPGFAATLALYVAATLTYSLRLKREAVIDVVLLSGLYTVRVIAGTYAAGTSRSPWLLMFCLFLFLGLAVVKRCSELVLARQQGRADLPGRGYRAGDLPVMLALAAAAGYGAVLVFAFYLSSPEMALLYRHSERLWAACPVLLAWTSRVLLLAGRGELHDDPVVFALTDRTSLATGACFAAVILSAI